MTEAGRAADPNGFAGHLSRIQRPLLRGPLVTLQINVGRRCNQACRHCHVDAAPWRTEMMDETTYRRIAEWILRHPVGVVDITGGAPELSEWFRPLVRIARGTGARVIDRNNLTILTEAGQEDLAGFLSRNGVEVIASLPCYSPENVRRQRGNGVFERSIEGLRRLNAVGYGTALSLHLVYNPVGPTLPGPQAELEADYREALRAGFGIEFTGLYALTNQPIARFAQDLAAQGRLEAYQELLVSAFNPETIDGLMCRSTLSVGYRGELHDCDFNQMLDMPLGGSSTRWLWDLDPKTLEGTAIATGAHCFACTAGSGSSCTGTLH